MQEIRLQDLLFVDEVMFARLQMVIKSPIKKMSQAFIEKRTMTILH